MEKIVIAKADPITKNEPVKDVTLEISATIPEHVDLEAAEKFYKEEAKKILDVLSEHVCQGVRHQLLILMLEDSKSLYRGL